MKKIELNGNAVSLAEILNIAELERNANNDVEIGCESDTGKVIIFVREKGC